MTFEEDQGIGQLLEVGFPQEAADPRLDGLERGRSNPKDDDADFASEPEVVQTSEVQIRGHEDPIFSHGSVEDLLVRQPPVALLKWNASRSSSVKTRFSPRGTFSSRR